MWKPRRGQSWSVTSWQYQHSPSATTEGLKSPRSSKGTTISITLKVLFINGISYFSKVVVFFICLKLKMCFEFFQYQNAISTSMPSSIVASLRICWPLLCKEKWHKYVQIYRNLGPYAIKRIISITDLFPHNIWPSSIQSVKTVSIAFDDIIAFPNSSTGTGYDDKNDKYCFIFLARSVILGSGNFPMIPQIHWLS